MFSIVLVGRESSGKSAISTILYPSVIRSGNTLPHCDVSTPQPIISLFTVDFPSAGFENSKDNPPPCISQASVIVHVMNNPDDDSILLLLRILKQHQINAKVYLFFHQVSNENFDRLRQLAEDLELKAFFTTNSVASIRGAFSEIVSSLFHNRDKMSLVIDKVKSCCLADRVILYDTSTFLTLYDTNPEKTETVQPLFDFCLHNIHGSKKIEYFLFQFQTTTVVSFTLAEYFGIFVCASNSFSSADAILFNLKRLSPSSFM